MEDGDLSLRMTASDLQESLNDLARSAIDLNRRSLAHAVLFDEPGEHQILISKKDQSLDYEVRWFDDWAY